MEAVFSKIQLLLNKDYPNSEIVQISERELNLTFRSQGFYLGVQSKSLFEADKIRSFLLLMGAHFLTTLSKEGKQVLVYFVEVKNG